MYLLFNKTEPIKGIKHQKIDCLLICSFVFMSRAFPVVFMNLIYPETQVIMILAIFMLTYYMAIETDDINYYIMAVIFAIYASYCKEPVFGIFLIIAITNILFKIKISKKEKTFYTALIFNGVIFLWMYYMLALKDSSYLYNEGRVYIAGFKFIISIFAYNPILVLLFTIGLIRLFCVIIKKERSILYYDSLLFAGMGYILAYALLHLNSSYYFLPAIVLFLPSLIYWIKFMYLNDKAYSLFLSYFIVVLYTLNGSIVYDISHNLQERNKFIPYINDLVYESNNNKQFVWYDYDCTSTGDTFYIVLRDFKKYTINAFLNYVSKTEGHDFFTLRKVSDELDFNKDILFFYAIDNNQNQPMPESLVKQLADNHFELHEDSYGILIYKRHAY
jgi:hypothetical protein